MATVRSGLSTPCVAGILFASTLLACPLGAQTYAEWGLDDADPDAQLAEDRGVSALVPRLRALRTTASLLHTTAHPDDEQAGMLTLLARGRGVRTTLLSLTRGEGGANAVGPELFDALGIIRTEELRLSGRYYGLAALYFTTAVDYGFSKTLEEAERSWNREAVLGDMVRVIRSERPLVVVSRWHGSSRDGHGHHQLSGVLTPEAVRAAADPSRFPDQIHGEGLRPWRVRALFRGGIREEESAEVAIETTQYAASLGTTFQEFAAHGLSLQRSQTAGRLRRASGPVVYRYERVARLSEPSGDVETAEFFSGLDTSLPGLFDLMEEVVGPEARQSLVAADRTIARAIREVDPGAPSTILPLLVKALGHVERAHAGTRNAPDSRLVLQRMIQGLHDVLRLSAGVSLSATVLPGGDGQASSPRVVAGESFDVVANLSIATGSVRVVDLRVVSPEGWTVTAANTVTIEEDRWWRRRFHVVVPDDALPDRPYFSRTSIGENHYEVADSSAVHRPWGPPPVRAFARLNTGGRDFEVRTVVRVEFPDPPSGVRRQELRVAPLLSLRTDPQVSIIGNATTASERRISVHLSSAGHAQGQGQVELEGPRGWSVTPPLNRFVLAADGSSVVHFRVRPSALKDGENVFTAVATLDGRTFAETVQIIQHPDLEERSLVAPARSTIRVLDVSIPPDLEVGYVSGVGDLIPDALRALGARVEDLTGQPLRNTRLEGYDAIVLGTRAYAIRPDLVAANDRLLAYVEGGGHLVILYQTPEFDPSSLAPYPAVLPARPEEVSEEDAPVAILAPDHPLLSWPNRITEDDFDGWMEQRGSKFFSEWDPAFVPLVETHDRGQVPQRGVWLNAPYGTGHYTYAALALHRQTPYAVPGAYRILANLVSLSRMP